MHQNSYDLFVKHALPHFQKGMTVLEVGPDKNGEPLSLKELLTHPEIDYWSVDLTDPYGGIARIGATTPYRYTSHDSYYDIVFSANVVEHVRRPWQWFKELARVTKPGGLVISVSPLSWPYHEAPVDCWRLYPEAYKALFEEAGLECVLTETRESPQVEERWLSEHGNKPVIDCIAVGRKHA